MTRCLKLVYYTSFASLRRTAQKKKGEAGWPMTVTAPTTLLFVTLAVNVPGTVAVRLMLPEGAAKVSGTVPAELATPPTGVKNTLTVAESPATGALSVKVYVLAAPTEPG